ncbi:hypothetical protein [Ferribacterium limneticum]|uniref:hypothetical protein n=1 Tax=Ferribacterium limneticum TaxID=76259 RepID=UPI001CF8215B|nr:hypothetical protein [Ferribacterium limneticum]UCV26768.1 hypothetical protein KI617_10645 [Ferribacterium limneticum]UCV30685.1 hypothetical protein KI608_10645 [Ferribacterium limneticum]
MQHQFKVGDKVKLVRKVTTQEGWEDIWVDSMDNAAEALQGKELLVEHINEDGVGIYPSGCIFNYPSDAFDLVEALETSVEGN